MTLSISALCPESGQLGIAITSSSIAVGARCPWLHAGIGAVASQNITLPSLGIQTLAGLGSGLSAEQAMKLALGEDRFSEYRQIAVISANGEIAAFSGEYTLGIGQIVVGADCVAAGNMLANHEVIEAMVHCFETTAGELAARLIAALQAGVAAGGEAGPLHSAAVKIVEDYDWPIVDLRIDWAETWPVAELEALWLAYEPQMNAYLTRALDPREAPSYGVPGDE